MLFLKEYCHSFKKKHKTFSHRYISDKLGYRSSGFFLHIIRGERKLSESLISKMCKLFQFNKREAEYFTLLTHLNQSKSVSDKVHNLYNMIIFTKKNLDSLTKKQLWLFFRTYFISFLAVISCDSFYNEYSYLIPEFNEKFAEREIEESIKFFNTHFPEKGRLKKYSKLFTLFSIGIKTLPGSEGKNEN